MRKLTIVLITSMIILCVFIGEMLGSFAASSTNTISSYGSIENAQVNQLSNGDFSNGFTGWKTWTNSGGQQANPPDPPNNYLSLDYSIYHNAAPSCKILADPYSVTPGDPSVWRAASLRIYGGEHFIVQVWVYVTGGSGMPRWSGARVDVDFRQADGAFIGPGDTANNGGPCYVSQTYPPYNYVHWGTSGWVLVRTEYVAPLNAGLVCLWIQNMPPQGNGVVYFDDAAIILVN